MERKAKYTSFLKNLFNTREETTVILNDANKHKKQNAETKVLNRWLKKVSTSPCTEAEFWICKYVWWDESVMYVYCIAPCKNSATMKKFSIYF